ncbi:hypothetical protein [Aliivibrio wodanis]|uniref:hypothetical protein n=1 Tax=Aliivibrio wodanis TaxID=80852 RepID=UPI00406C2A9F
MTKNNERLHFYHISMSLHFTDGSTDYREIQISSTSQFVSRSTIEKCKQDAIKQFSKSPHPRAAHIYAQAISYLGFMTNAEFFDESLDFTGSN